MFNLGTEIYSLQKSLRLENNDWESPQVLMKNKNALQTIISNLG